MSRSPNLFLGVARSALGRPWCNRLDGPGLALAENLVQVEGLGDTLARVLAARGVDGAHLAAFLEPRLRDLMPDPLTMTDMAACVAPVQARFWPAIWRPPARGPASTSPTG
jgi:single-stranded-DNA-specific exonuclease